MDPPVAPSDTVPRSVVLALAKRIAALGALLLLLTFTVSALKGYRVASSAASARAVLADMSVSASATPDRSVPPAQGVAVEPTPSASVVSSRVVETAVIVVAGVNFRKAPRRGSEVIRPALLGERLEVVGRSDGWLRVRDSAGLVGWITSGARYVRIESGGR